MNAEATVYGQSDSEGCLLVVGSYSDVASPVGSAVAKAESRILMSPELGDFTEIRFVDLGSRPTQQVVDASAIPRIVRELLGPVVAERNYFAFAVIDRSAAKAESILGELAATPFAAVLPMRFCGLATVDDRKPLKSRDATNKSATDDLVLLIDSFNVDNLVSALVRFANESMLSFSDGREGGLTPEEIDRLIPAYGEGEGTDNQKPAGGGGRRRQMSRIPMSWLSSVLRKARGRSSTPNPISSPNDVEADAYPEGLVLLILYGSEWSDGRDACRRGQAMLLQLDKKLGMLSRPCYQVHGLQASVNKVEAHPERAGQLSRRDIKMSSVDLDLAGSLKAIHSVLRKDLAPFASLKSRPFIVFFAVDPPFADAVSVEIYNELALEALIIWVLPEQSVDTLSSAFACHGARIMADRPAVVDDILYLLQEAGSDAEAGAASGTSLSDARAEKAP